MVPIDPTTPRECRLAVTRTARYYLLGDAASPAIVWFALHGYGHSVERFARGCAPLAGPGRLVVVPEALSRFYLETAHGAHAAAAVGASWMTREAREAEITDYVAYLDALHAALAATVDWRTASCRLLGFSQGAATASRWAALGAARIDRLVLWGGHPPDELDWPAVRDRLAAMRPVLVAGEQDAVVAPATLERTAVALARHGIAAAVRRHPGAHRLDAALLAELAAE
jgi:predicted esterase